ncbi:hypothetical protein TVAG_436140 [Trichomonas vaginalis G3]|uniref:BTB domain-containing protein n=1 Tax=Trichomonas vaginalis (strain ATCC PRA-98 / G3) TaxID=412133 RepID=A2G542_TRIV3|nr:protein ubiquitination [Trichomonas vaginalis G3]EAX87722.1 hypothetical protein TVAG_436140 [Trichomonas vaginalis G3]KAI5545975.1 protein ubiquitination [Trichomonas vaginalis G3]|eukprot:XP_001300652.1 hypothetical protein [Trichomonas vaginalis G3]
MDEEEFSLSVAGLSNPGKNTLPLDFCFIVNGKKYYCYSLYADFLSPKIAKLHEQDPKLDKFEINIEDEFETFDLALQLMYGEEISPNALQSNYLNKLGKILENEEICKATEQWCEQMSPQDAILLLIHNPDQGRYKDIAVEIVAKSMYELNSGDLKDVPVQILNEIFVNPKLAILNEETFFTIIMDLINLKGPEYRALLSHVDFHHLSTDSMKKFVDTVSTHDVSSVLWRSLHKRLTMEVKERRIQTRYIKKEIPIPYDDKDPHNGVFTYLRKQCGGKNPVDAHLVELKSGDTECSVAAKLLLDYGTKARWYLAEKENNTLTFDFKHGKFALSAYTITSGSSSSYWEYPTSFIWEGSNDDKKYELIDEKKDNKDLGANEKTYTWKCNLSQLYRYIRFRLKNVTRHGGLYCREFELFGAYQEPETEAWNMATKE